MLYINKEVHDDNVKNLGILSECYVYYARIINKIDKHIIHSQMYCK